MGMGCGTSLHHYASIAAVAAACLALVGYSWGLTWDPRITAVTIGAARMRATEVQTEQRRRGIDVESGDDRTLTEVRRGWVWLRVHSPGLALPLLVTLALLTLTGVVDVPGWVNVLFFATVVPIGVVDIAHAMHCKAVANGTDLDEELQSINRVAQRAGQPILIAGVGLTLATVVIVVLSSLC
jgi:hypothetical protein